jgi:hypothetical protein
MCLSYLLLTKSLSPADIGEETIVVTFGNGTIVSIYESKDGQREAIKSNLLL